MALSKKNVTESADANMVKILMLLTKHEENINSRLDLMERKIDGINMEILDKIKDLNKRVNDVEKAIDFYGKQYESQKKMSDNLLKSNTFLSEENKVLKTKINNLRADQEKQKCALNELQQYGRRECIEVSGVPPTDNEDSEEIIMAIAKEIGVTLENNEISACHRVKKAKGDPIIIAKFTNRKIKEEFMTKRRNLKHKSIGSLKLSNVDGKINGKVFINESLTPMNRNLFRLTRIKCKEKSWNFSWTRNGVVFARKNEQSLIAKISCVKELEQKLG